MLEVDAYEKYRKFLKRHKAIMTMLNDMADGLPDPDDAKAGHLDGLEAIDGMLQDALIDYLRRSP